MSENKFIAFRPDKESYVKLQIMKRMLGTNNISEVVRFAINYGYHLRFCKEVNVNGDYCINCGVKLTKVMRY